MRPRKLPVMKIATGWKRPTAMPVRTTKPGTATPTWPDRPGFRATTILEAVPPPESLKDEAGVHRKVANYFLLHPEAGRDYLVETTRRVRTLRRGISVLRATVRCSQDHGQARMRASSGNFPQPRLLQGRPVHARIRLRHFFSLWTVWRRDPSLCPDLPEQPALQDGERLCSR